MVKKKKPQFSPKEIWKSCNCYKCELFPNSLKKIGDCPYYKDQDKMSDFMKYKWCPVQVSLINGIINSNKQNNNNK